MRNFLLLTVGFLFLFSSSSFAQIVGGDVFLQGHWLEVGVDNMGAFGTCSSPTGYHAHGLAVSGSATCYSSGDALDACYDWGHDGWGVGTPCEMGDYTIPGTPQEGWGMQYNGVEYRNWADGYITGSFTNPECTGPFNIPGTITGYTNISGSAAGTFTGATAGMNVIQETRVDTQASWVVITTRMYNTTAASITGVYYERTCDPDNTSFWPGGSSVTENVIVHQNEDAAHHVEVGTYGQTTGYNRYNSWMSLATKDCRARCYVINPTAANDYSDLYPETGITPADIWSGGSGFTEALGDSGANDVGIYLLFNIGTITAGDSAVISYAYVYDGPTGIDSAFPDPVLLVGNDDSILPSVQIPYTVSDTFNACGLNYDSLNINILNATTRNWTWSHWTWSPSTGLSSTTGTVNTINTTVLPSYITYTITGTDSAGSGVMLNCQNKVLYLTVLACNQCTNNSPCQGDTLLLTLKGDSTGATYAWTGPAGFTSTLQDPYIYPATLTNTGEYYVIRTLLGVHDTDSTNVVIHPTPVVTVSSNAPLCMGNIDTLRLSVTPASGGVSFSWTGPDAFTSALEFPVVDGFTAINAGIYKVVATTSFGCTDSGTIDAELVPPPSAPPISGDTAYCYAGTFVPLVASGTDIMWYPYDTSTTGTGTPPVVNTRLPGFYTLYATQQLGSCVSPKDSIKVHVYPRIDPDFSVTIKHGCSSDEAMFMNTSSNSIYYTWNWGDGSGTTDSSAALLGHVHTYAPQNIYNVVLTGYNSVCSGDTTIPVDTRHSVHALFTPVPDTFCVGYTTTFDNASVAWVYPTLYTSPIGDSTGHIAGYVWNFGDGSAVDSTDTNPSHAYLLQGAYPVTLVATDTIGCMDTLTETVYALQIHIQSVNDTTLCLSQPLPLYNTITLVPDINLTDYTYVWGQSSPNLNDTADTAINVQVPYVTGIGTYTDTLTVMLPNILPNGCPASDTVTIHSVMGAPVIDVTPNTTITYGSSINLNADGQVYYTWLPNNGSLNNNNVNNPVATPAITTTYTVFGLDGNGCLDSAYVTITVDSTMFEGAPSAFTPNNDGLNDTWRPLGLKYQRLVEFRIFDRWGQQVFYSNDINNGWDGKFNGVPQDIGVYYYVIIVSSPENQGGNITYKGDLTLMR